MKINILKTIATILLFLGIGSCTLEDFSPAEWAVTPELTVSETYIVFNREVLVDTITVTTNYENFTAVSAEEWCHITLDADNSRFYINVDPNTTAEQRISIISVSVSRGNKSMTKEVSVIQLGGIWDTIGDFKLHWQNEVSESQREAITEILEAMKYIEGGSFLMGEGEDEHQVTLSPYYIGKYELTQKQWNAIIYTNPSIYRGDNLPVENISWTEALEFVTKLSNLTNLKFNLPTEAQWEYAARGGKKSLGYKYPGSDDCLEVAHMVDLGLSEDNPLYSTTVGGTKLPNELGLYDMAGNVSEFCFDWYDADYSNVPTNENPTGVESGERKVVRGGNFTGLNIWCESTYRYQANIKYQQEKTGIRLCLNI